MGFAEYGRHDAVGLAALVRDGQVRPEELLDEALARTAAANPKINAVIHLMEERARAAIATGLPDGPFRGVPFLVKDLMTACAGEPMRSGSRLFRDFVPPADEELTRRYKAAGLVIFGKTNTPEFGVSNVTEPELFGPTRNPWNLERTSSGSSGGSAAAVAARIVPAANANDGGGSIRTPASNCGLVGLKPSRGRNPTGPQLPDVWFGFIGEHVVTRTVRDSAAMLDATCGDYAQQLMKLPPPARSFLEETQATAGRLRIGYSFDPGLGRTVHAENRKALEATIAALVALGHELVDVRLPLQRETFVACYAALISAEVAATLRMAPALVGREARSEDVELATWVLASMGEAQSGAEVAASLQALQTFSRQWLAWCASFDVLLTPTVGVPPLPIGAYRLPKAQRAALKVLTALPGAALLSQRDKVLEAFEPVFEAAPYTMVANVTGQPSMSLPLHWTEDGLPMGLLFTASRIGDEATLFRLAAQLEQAVPWAHRVAPNAIP
ncbi:MAG TPA: amidase [Steroidobacteraceae bacterium]|nr:amidase [Steroidobacteraceae bacterium]